jgi:nicotinamide-nucleotide amidase
LAEAGERVPLVLITGGLGPTRDDKTKTAICEFFNTQLVEDSSVLENVINLLGKRSIPINQLNREQALVPESAVVLPNEMGTAPGLWLKKKECIYVFMPGVPFEMKNLMEKEVLPKIRQELQTSPILHHTIQVFGISESALAEKISEWEDSLLESVKLAYLPSPEGIRLRLSTSGKDKEQLDQIIKEKVHELSQVIPQYIIGFREETLSANIGKLLKTRRKTVSTAESCTGGNIAHSITAISGSSEYFKGSVVAYSNEAKINILSFIPGAFCGCAVYFGSGLKWEAAVIALVSGAVLGYLSDIAAVPLTKIGKKDEEKAEATN